MLVRWGEKSDIQIMSMFCQVIHLSVIRKIISNVRFSMFRKLPENAGRRHYLKFISDRGQTFLRTTYSGRKIVNVMSLGFHKLSSNSWNSKKKDILYYCFHCHKLLQLGNLEKISLRLDWIGFVQFQALILTFWAI